MTPAGHAVEDMKRRGLREPVLVVIDGNSGLRKAGREGFPDSWVQGCQAHRMRNILCKLPEKARPGLKKLIRARDRILRSLRCARI